MTDKLNRKNPLLEEYNKLSSIPEVIAHSNQTLLVTEGDNDEGGVGTATLSVEQLSAWQALFNEDRRKYEGQGKFASGPDSLSKKHLGSSCGLGGSLQAHPLLSQSQQFSGDDPVITANPTENSEASERFLEKRLENRLRLQKNLGLGASKNIAPVR
ncbi:MAG: hypothetical protein E6K54_04835 [Gammaproteobacteria bacterium]|nr:MAG: hypothetical protein E6K54_04835 [Gammaproteobacteria bacterium]